MESTYKLKNQTTPFTYYVENHTTGLKYYGVRYAKGCHPSDLWQTYFTSSRVIKNLLIQYGKGDFTVKVRRTFESKEEAIEWEARVLTRIDASRSPNWINRTNGNGRWFNQGGYRHTDKARRRQSISKKGNVIVNDGNRARRVKPEEVEEYLAKGWSLGFAFVDRSSFLGKKKVHKDGKVLFVEEDEIPDYLNQGWKRGDGNRACSGMVSKYRGSVFIHKDGRAKIIMPENLQSYLDRGWQRGNVPSKVKGFVWANNGIERKQFPENEIPDGWKLGMGAINHFSYMKVQVKCPHCQKEGAGMIMKRWHFDNCKKRT